MVNNENFLDRTNFSDVFLRQVIVGFLGFLKDRFRWTNIGENGPYDVVLPVHYSLTGDNRYIMDAFYDDVPGMRVNMNTDSVPRAMITLKSWEVKTDEFTNPNVWINVNREIDGELRQIVTQTKAVPIKLSFSLDTLLDNEIDVFKCWQTYMDNMWIYRYFTYDFAKVPINAVFNFIADTENSIVRDYKFGDLNVIKTTHNFDIHTFYPIFDLNHAFNANNAVQWILQIWQNPNQPLS
jgi:hypothetical protein